MFLKWAHYIIQRKFIIGWTEWTSFNETNQVRYRKCNNETFGQVKGLLISSIIIIFKEKNQYDILGKEPCSSTAILNLGFASRSQGVCKKAIWVECLILGYTKGVQFLFWDLQMGTILNWGYAEGYNFKLGYASKKRLRTPVLVHYIATRVPF